MRNTTNLYGRNYTSTFPFTVYLPWQKYIQYIKGNQYLNTQCMDYNLYSRKPVYHNT